MSPIPHYRRCAWQRAALRFGLPPRPTCLVIALVILLGPISGSDAVAAPRPNVVLIMLDDFGYECVTANGGSSYQTPHLDRLAATGMRGEHCYVQPLCTPTRAQLMTGQYNVRNYTRFGHLDTSQTTFAHLFQRAGYRTCIAGKWQLGRDQSLPGHFGFDQYCLWQLDRRPPRYANPGLEIDGQHLEYSQGEYGPRIINDYACRFIAENHDQPFLLYYPMVLTHAPFQPTPDSADWDARATGEAHGNERHFANMVTYADKMIGRIVEALERHRLRDNTLLLVLGDNGTGRSITSRVGSTLVKGGKGSPTERGMHVPLIANWPGQIAPGGVLADLVDSTDFLPTICEAAGILPPNDLTLDGRSFLAPLRGQKGAPRPWIYCWYSPEGGPTAQAEFAMNRQYKLHADGRLFDLIHDREEQQPLTMANFTPEAAAAHKTLSEAIEKHRGVRPAAIVAQAGPKGKKRDE